MYELTEWISLSQNRCIFEYLSFIRRCWRQTLTHTHTWSTHLPFALLFRMWEQLKRRSSYQALPTIESKKPNDIYRDLHHPIFQNIRIIHVFIDWYCILVCFVLFFNFVCAFGEFFFCSRVNFNTPATQIQYAKW